MPLLDGHNLDGRVFDVTAEGLKLEGLTQGGGAFTMSLSADHVDPYWWVQKRDAALGDDVQGRLELSVWAVEHGLFRQAKTLFAKARASDPEKAAAFQDHVLPGLREGIAADHARQAAIESKEALAKSGGDLTAHTGDGELVERLDALKDEAQAGLVQSHTTAGDVYTATGDYEDALGQAKALELLDPNSGDAHAMRTRVHDAQAEADDGIRYGVRGVVPAARRR